MTDSVTHDADRALRAHIADLAQTSRDGVSLTRRLDEQGIDSLHLIVLRERLQDALAWRFSDEDWSAVRTPADILVALEAQSGPSTASALLSPAWSASLARDEIEIGMPLTGRNNLGETPLLQYLGDLRWRHISHAMGVPSREIRDDGGERLYATFFYVDVAFPEATPMAAFGENDRFTVVSTLARYGTSMLDGTSYLLPSGTAHRASETGAVPFSSLEEAVAAGVPAVRLSNIFVRQFAGAEWLKKGRPAHPGFTRIPALAEPPDSSVLTKQAEQRGHFGSRGPGSHPGWIAMTDGPIQQEYRLIPDRDLNGAGLVYFANYPMFLDICERAVLASANVPLATTLLDRRTLVRRQSAYLNNASATDTLRIEIEPWIHEHGSAPGTRAGTVDLRLHLDYRMYRRSDDRLMMVSMAQKVVRGVSPDDIPAPVLSSAANPR